MASENKDEMGTNKRIIRAGGHEFLTEDEGNRTRISIKIDGVWEHATTVNTDNQTATEWIEANVRRGHPSRWLPYAFSRPGEPDTFAVEDRFYFGKGRKERFGVEDRVDSLIAGAYRALKNGDKSAAKRMIREAEVLASSEPNLPTNILNDLKDLKKSVRF